MLLVWWERNCAIYAYSTHAFVHRARFFGRRSWHNIAYSRMCAPMTQTLRNPFDVCTISSNAINMLFDSRNFAADCDACSMLGCHERARASCTLLFSIAIQCKGQKKQRSFNARGVTLTTSLSVAPVIATTVQVTKQLTLVTKKFLEASCVHILLIIVSAWRLPIKCRYFLSVSVMCKARS